MFLQDPRTMTDRELEIELNHYQSGHVTSLLDDSEIPEWFKYELIEHEERLRRECAKRDGEIVFPLESFGVTDFF